MNDLQRSRIQHVAYVESCHVHTETGTNVEI